MSIRPIVRKNVSWTKCHLERMPFRSNLNYYKFGYTMKDISTEVPHMEASVLTPHTKPAYYMIMNKL
jgi:hypothetical protein